MADEEVHRRLAKASQQNDNIELTSLEGQSTDADNQELNPLVQGPTKSSISPLSIDDGHGGPPPGSASVIQVVVNIIISFVGAGMLGVPNAFSKSGWLLGSVTLLTVSALNVYAMLCLPAALQGLLDKQRPSQNNLFATYGDVGRAVLGPKGETLVHVCLGISQAGFATAYIIFIAANLYSIAQVPRILVCTACIPGLLILVQFRDLKSLSPFSLVANTANFAALSAVLFQDYESYQPHNDAIHKLQWNGFLYVIAVTIYR